MKRYSKPLGNLLDFKQEIFRSNDEKLAEYQRIAATYRSQPRRTACKNCSLPVEFAPGSTFTKLEVDYAFCSRCGHCNGAHEDTTPFCRALYTEDQGQNYARNYTEDDAQKYHARVGQIYQPKAAFLKEALAEVSAFPASLADFGAGAGYFVAAARGCGFTDVVGYEPSEALAAFGNAMLGPGSIVHHKMEDTAGLIGRTTATTASLIGVLEHLQNPREILDAVSRNKNIRHTFLLLPLFSPSVVIETVFPGVMPRHLVAGHTHLYTEQSIRYFCEEFGFKILSEWWFGLDITDMYRSILISLEKTGHPQGPLLDYFSKNFMPAIDALQAVLDERRLCSEVHMLLGK